VLVNDFIDMRKEKHRRGVERALRDAVKRDRARTKILRTSPFGLIEMTRQRVRPSLKRSTYTDCPCCSGTGVIKSAESMAIEVIRQLTVASQTEDVAKISITVAAEVAEYLSNKKRRQLIELEDEGKLEVDIVGLADVSGEHLAIDCRDAQGREVRIEP
jgi:ribonuclease E